MMEDFKTYKSKQELSDLNKSGAGSSNRVGASNLADDTDFKAMKFDL